MSSVVARRNVLPGFGLTLGISLFVVTLLLVLPLVALFVRTSGVSASVFVRTITSPRVLAAFRLSLVASVAAALVNTVFGLATAWAIERYRFFGRGLVDTLIDVPFALPTSVAGITLATLYGRNGAIGSLLGKAGIEVAYATPGILIALIFVTLPFAVRALQPVIRDLDPELEEAAASLGASRLTTFLRVTLPELRPALLTAFTLSFARAIGEYGSVIFIAGNMPMKTEIVPLVIMIHLDQFEYGEACAIAVTYMFVAMLLIAAVQVTRRRSAV